MDLSGHKQFLGPVSLFAGDLPRPDAPCPTELRPAEPRPAAGPALLLAAWSALQSARIEAVDLHLRSGSVIAGAIRLRLAGPLAQAST
ncbi:MAG: hypothetical protein SNJ79_08500, partial [Sphingomonadaceae bacterium]